MFNKNVKEQFKKFFGRDDTFSFGVCNGCQLMSFLGWVAPYQDDSITTGEQFVSIFVAHKILNKVVCHKEK